MEPNRYMDWYRFGQPWAAAGVMVYWSLQLECAYIFGLVWFGLDDQILIFSHRLFRRPEQCQEEPTA